MKQLLLLLAIISISTCSFAQQLQTIRGHISDKESKTPLPSANVIVLDSNPLLGTTTDSGGNFVLKVPVGRQSFKITFIGYKPAVIPSLIVNSAKEIVLEVELEENVITGEEIIVKGTSKDKPKNTMSFISARSFTVEETEKYAGSRGDVSRMAMNYAGVASANDQRNDIIVRGNSPSGLLWKLEDVNIPNPNHFAENGTTGGPVGMINNNVLQNSDFMTSAFPAEYGNALSGVFDLSMRNGNNQKHEHLFQVGFNGFEVGSEGPLTKKHQSSYLVNFRYSTMQLMNNLINFGTSGIPEYQDLTFKLNFPLKKGKVTIFGLGGNSRIAMLDSKNGNEQDMYSNEGQDLINRSKMGATGISYTQFINENTWSKITLSGVYQEGGTSIDTLDINNIPHANLDHNYSESRVSVSGFIHRKFNNHFSLRSGFVADRTGFNLLTKIYNNEIGALRPEIDFKKNIGNGVNLLQPYAQAVYKFSNRFNIAPGIHFTWFDLNNSIALEPRIAANWSLSQRQKLSLGYGLHSKTQPLSAYFLGTYLPNGNFVETNKNLDMTRSHQLVLGYDLQISGNTRLKAETYYQYLFRVPVEERRSSFSMLNTGAGWGVPAQDSLVNKGTGKNYGLELTLERFFSNSIYYLATVSLFESKYKGSDGIERNTAFNGNYVTNLLIGKELQVNNKSSFNIDFKLTFAGGKRYSPIDLSASQKAYETKYIDAKAYSLQFDPFFKADIKFGYRLNGKRISQEWVFYIENFTNHKNILMQSYSPSKNEVKNINQLGVFPMMQYRLYF